MSSDVRQRRIVAMRFVETRVFTELVCRNLDDHEYRALQSSLLLRPEQGPVIPGAGDLRKIRWGAKGGGKRGGFRLIYFWDKPSATSTCCSCTGRTSRVS